MTLYATADPTRIPAAAPRWTMFVARFRRQHAPLVRYWDAEMNYLGTDPSSGRIESWPSWTSRQARRGIAICQKIYRRLQVMPNA